MLILHLLLIVFLLPYGWQNGTQSPEDEFPIIFILVDGYQHFHVTISDGDVDYSQSFKPATCPHSLFTLKHCCPTCTDAADALAFSQNVRVGNLAAHWNTVLFGEVQFQLVGHWLCQSTPATVMKCDLVHSWCHLVGERCITNHTKYGGHLFHKQIRCDDG